MYRVIGGETALVDGWQYEWEYPALPEQPDLEPDRAYVLVMLAAETPAGRPPDDPGACARVRAGEPVGAGDKGDGPGPVGQGVRAVGGGGRARDPVRGARASERCGRRELRRGLTGMGDIITGTPANLTYGHELVRQVWVIVWAITSGALVVIIGWMGLNFIVAEHLGRPQAGWREMVPRLVLGLVAAATSLWWCALVIDVADAVSGFIAATLEIAPGDLLRSSLDTLVTAVSAGSVGMALLLAFLYLAYGFFVLYVLVQFVVRLALIDLLLALAPIALGLWILPHTAGWGRHWLKLFMTTVFQQAVQLIALAFAFGFLADFADIAPFEPVRDLVWKLLLSLSFVYLTTRVPSLMGNPGTFDAWLHTLYFGMSLPGSIVRSARSIGTVAGGHYRGRTGRSRGGRGRGWHGA